MSGRGPVEHLSDFERRALAIVSATNETVLGKQLQTLWLDRAVYPMVRASISRRTYVDGANWMRDWRPERGTLLAANHRSFFDQWLLMLTLWTGELKFFENIFFPVRANYFYETKAGVALNYLMGGGSLYPPVFRDREKASYNKHALERVVAFLSDPRSLVGVHPEGKRNKNPNPYELLRAQPGVGQMVLQGRPHVIPAFVNGLSNSFFETVRADFRKDIRRDNPIIMVFGEPLDYSEFTEQKPRAALYKKCSDRILERIRELGERERELRAKCAAGEIADDDPGWLRNRRAR